MSCMLTTVLFLPWRRCSILVHSEDTHGNPAPALKPPVNFTSTVSHSLPGLLSHVPPFFDQKALSFLLLTVLSVSVCRHKLSLSPTLLSSLHATDAPLLRLLSLCSERFPCVAASNSSPPPGFIFPLSLRPPALPQDV